MRGTGVNAPHDDRWIPASDRPPAWLSVKTSHCSQSSGDAKRKMCRWSGGRMDAASAMNCFSGAIARLHSEPMDADDTKPLPRRTACGRYGAPHARVRTGTPGRRWREQPRTAQDLGTGECRTSED